MNPDETPRFDPTCVVCGKDTSGGRGFMTLHLPGRLIALCCPLCRKVYEETPARYAQYQQTQQAIRDIEHKLGAHHSE